MCAFAQPQVGKSGKKICCSCPETRNKRDECVVREGEDKCKELIEAHNVCLRAEGFKV
jgi:cytochrome c oxidase assembly protein subunit 17